MKKLIYIIIVFALFSCDKDNDEQELSKLGLPVIDVSFIDSDGSDMLNPQTPSAFNEDGIKLYYMEEGEKVEFYQANLTHPRNCFVYCERPVCALRIALKDTTLIELNEFDTDTIYLEKLSTMMGKVWYNGELVWDVWDPDHDVTGFITILK